MRAALLLCFGLVGCHDFDDELRRCVDAGRCAVEGDAGARDAGAGDAGSDAGSPNDAQLVCAGGVCWESPRPTGLRVDDVVAVSASEAWFVGSGVVTHVVGDRLDSFTTGSDARMSVATDGTRVLAVQGSQVWDLVARAGHETANTEFRVIHHAGAGNFVIGGVSTLVGLGENLALTNLQPLFKDVNAITGRRGALLCSVSDGVQGALLAQRDATDLTQGWTSIPGPDGGDYRALAVDSLGRSWVAVGEETWFDDGAWSLAAPIDVSDLEAEGAMMNAVTLRGEVLQCSAPTACTTRLTGELSLTATSSAGGVQYVAGEHGTMLRLEPDGGVTRLAGQHSAAFHGLQVFADGTGWAAADTGLWKRVDGGWSRALASMVALNDVAVIDGVLRVAADDGMLQVVGGQLKASRMVTPADAGASTRMVAVRDDGNDGGVAVGINGAVFRLSGPGTWTTAYPLDGGRSDCKWAAYVDAGGDCTFGDVLPRANGFVAVGHINNTIGLVVSVSGEEVVATQTSGVRGGITSLADGGVFICGSDKNVQYGDPAHLVEVVTDLPDSCVGVVRVGEQFVVATQGGIRVLEWSSINATWEVGQRRDLVALDAVTTLGDEVFAAGALTTIVRFKPDGG